MKGDTPHLHAPGHKAGHWDFMFRPRPSTKRVIVHCSHTPPSVERSLEYLRAAGRVVGLLEVGYHFIIERDGWLEQTRDGDAMGSHAPKNNRDSLGVCFALDGTEYPSGEQRRMFRHLCRTMFAAYGELDVVGHCECHGYRVDEELGSCPGFDMDKLREDCLVMSQLPLKLSTQQDIVVQYLKTGHTLTTLIAMTNLGIASLSSRVAELRALGYDIEGEDKLDFNGRRYVAYTLLKG